MCRLCGDLGILSSLDEIFSQVLNETADYYRYFDAAAHAEFLYSCVEQTIENDLPDEIRFLQAFNQRT